MDWQPSEDFLNETDIERPFGKTIRSIFARVQPMTGFGAECHRLIYQTKSHENLDNLNSQIDNFSAENNLVEGLEFLLRALDEISKKATRIGDAQRSYFQQSFRSLFNPNSDSYLNLKECWIRGKESYDSLYG